MFAAHGAKFNKQILFATFLIVICLFFNGCARKKAEVHRIGILCGLDYIASISDEFKSKMAELGYKEGENITYDIQRTNFELEKEKQILKKFVEDKVDLVFTFPTEVSMSAKSIAEGTGIPVLFCFANIEGTGLVESVRSTGGNITGVRYPGPDLAIKRLEVMLRLTPNVRKIWIPYQRGYPIVESQLEVLYPIAKSKGITLIEFPADDAAELKVELDKKTQLGDIGMDAVLFVAEPLTVTPDAFEVLAKFASEQKLPIGGALMKVGPYGSIFGVNVDLTRTAHQAAILADKILRGIPADTIPVVSSESFLEINYSTAGELGITVPEGLLSTADKVVR